MASDDYCYLTTTGRRTGSPHRIEIWYAAAGDTFYLLAGGGRRSDWVRNIEATPEVTVELGGETRSASGRVLDADTDEDAQARSIVFEKYRPRYSGDLTQWRTESLSVALDLQ